MISCCCDGWCFQDRDLLSFSDNNDLCDGSMDADAESLIALYSFWVQEGILETVIFQPLSFILISRVSLPDLGLLFPNAPLTELLLSLEKMRKDEDLPFLSRVKLCLPHDILFQKKTLRFFVCRILRRIKCPCVVCFFPPKLKDDVIIIVEVITLQSPFRQKKSCVRKIHTTWLHD